MQDIADHASGTAAEEVDAESYSSPQSELSSLIHAEKIIERPGQEPLALVREQPAERLEIHAGHPVSSRVNRPRTHLALPGYEC